MTRFLFTQEPLLIVLLSYSRWGDGKSTAFPIFISAAESALAGIGALVPVGSAPEFSHKRTEPQLSCRACGIYLHGETGDRGTGTDQTFTNPHSFEKLENVPSIPGFP